MPVLIWSDLSDVYTNRGELKVTSRISTFEFCSGGNRVAKGSAEMTENNPKDMVQYCYNPTTKEIVEGMYPPNEQFIPIIGYFKKATDPVELKKIFQEIASR